MDCCSRHCESLEDIFDPKWAEGDLRAYTKNGPAKATQVLLDAIRAHAPVRDRSLIDIGGGIGAIPLELYKNGLARSTCVDASAAYLHTAREEAAKRGFTAQGTYQHGNFVERAPDIAPADIVTLDRVICCYPDMPSLVRLSAERATRVYGLVSPRDRWWMRIGAGGMNLWERISRSAYRFFVHPDAAVHALLAERGMSHRFHKNVGIWQVNLWAASASPLTQTQQTPH
jgi:Methyltransferase small domain